MIHVGLGQRKNTIDADIPLGSARMGGITSRRFAKENGVNRFY